MTFIIACSEDDLTGASTLSATAPSLTVSLDFANDQTLVEQEISYGFTVSISEPQIVDININLSMIEGTATLGDDFSIPPNVTIPAGSTSVSDVISIHADELIEDTETAIIKIATGTEANVTDINDQTVSFSIANLTEGDLAITMSWSTSTTITDNFGSPIDATNAGDLRLLITDTPYTTVIGEADGASFEAYTIESDLNDGEYYVVADFYASTDIPTNFDLTLTFDQTGVINSQTHTFAEALNNASICEDNYYVMAKITKTGDSYTLEEIGSSNFVTTAWSGFDTYDVFAPDGWDSKITSSIDCDGTYFLGINSEWMTNVWQEEIQVANNVYYTINESGVITIPSQPIFTTLYNGDLYDYTVSGTGIYDDSGDSPVIHIEYILDQAGTDVGAYWNSEEGMDTPYFVADISL